MEPTCAFAELVPHSPYFAGVPASPADDEPLRVSRFAYLRREQALRLASPRAHAHLVLRGADALRLYYALCEGASPAELTRRFAELPAGEIAAFIRLLLAAAIVERVLRDDPDFIEEDTDEALVQWQFHDLLLHAESRMGRATGPIGGTHRFVRELPPVPALKDVEWAPLVELATPPDGDAFAAWTLADALAQRRTQRTQGAQPITVRQLGEFLHRCARVVSHDKAPWPREYPFGGEYTRRPYPNGGSRYELEIYIAAQRCEGLPRGLYYYDALGHRLATVSVVAGELDLLFGQATSAAGGLDSQLLITVTSRFQRSSWKYEGLAMALQLKNLGVLFAHFYLVATAMGLAPCALGSGDSDLFSRITGLDYLVEGSIGEFLLGSAAEPA
jgi:SagB-type dehydrogenase family enzyme